MITSSLGMGEWKVILVGFLYFFFILFIYLFLAALGFGCLAGASHCDDSLLGEDGL